MIHKYGSKIILIGLVQGSIKLKRNDIHKYSNKTKIRTNITIERIIRVIRID